MIQLERSHISGRALRDGIPPVLWRVGADPDGVHLLDVPVFRLGELGAVLRRNHTAAIVYAAFKQWITGIKIVLCFYIDN